MGTTQLGFTAEDGSDFFVNFTMLKNPYIGGLNGDPNNYDLPRIKVEDFSGVDWYFSTGENTSSFLDQWVTASITVDSDVGSLLVDVESDGIYDFSVQDDRLSTRN
ncbi:MAG: hypothetical protein GY788_01940 [bacterium]|nr:hypothetical protein [bacterium]